MLQPRQNVPHETCKQPLLACAGRVVKGDGRLEVAEDPGGCCVPIALAVAEVQQRLLHPCLAVELVEAVAEGPRAQQGDLEVTGSPVGQHSWELEAVTGVELAEDVLALGDERAVAVETLQVLGRQVVVGVDHLPETVVQALGY